MTTAKGGLEKLASSVKSGRLVVGVQRTGAILGPDGARIVRPAAPPEVRYLRVGDKVRALGLVYRVRKVTGKDVILRPVKKKED